MIYKKNSLPFEYFKSLKIGIKFHAYLCETTLIENMTK